MHWPFHSSKSDLYLQGDEIAAWQLPPSSVRWKRLGLRFAEVADFPFESLCFAHLRELDIVGVNFLKFPAEIFNLKQLRVLRLVNVKFAQFPTQICEMKQLRELAVRGAGLSAISDHLGQLQQLRALDLGGNELTGFDVDLRACRHLKWFQISDNPLEELPSLLPQNTCLGMAGTPFRGFIGWRFEDVPQGK